MKSYKIVLLRSSQIVQVSLFLSIMALVVLQFAMIIACIFKIDIGIPNTSNLTFGIYG